MAKPGTRVIVSDHSAEFFRSLELHAVEAMLAANAELAAMAKNRETARNTGSLRDSIHVLPVTKTTRGWACGVGASDWKANFYEKGTKAHANTRGTKNSGRRLTKSGKYARVSRKGSGNVSGVKALRYLKGSAFAMRPALIRHLQGAVDRASTRRV